MSRIFDQHYELVGSLEYNLDVEPFCMPFRIYSTIRRRILTVARGNPEPVESSEFLSCEDDRLQVWCNAPCAIPACLHPGYLTKS